MQKKRWKPFYDIKRKYCDSWEDEFPWLSPTSDGSERAYCTICQVDLMPKKFSIVSHHKSNRHQKKALYFIDDHKIKEDRDAFFDNYKSQFSWLRKNKQANHNVYCRVCHHTLLANRECLTRHQNTELHKKKMKSNCKTSLKEKVEVPELTDISDVITLNDLSSDNDEKITRFVSEEGDPVYIEVEELHTNESTKNLTTSSTLHQCDLYDSWKDFFSKHIQSIIELGDKSHIDNTRRNIIEKHILNHVVNAEETTCNNIENYINRNFNCARCKSNCSCNLNEESVSKVKSKIVKNCVMPIAINRSDFNPFVECQLG